MPNKVFKDKIRLRVNGILQENDALLLVQLRSPVTDELIWMPPGGGLQFGESMKEGLQREFAEETGLKINVGSFAFWNQMIRLPFHAVECYFNVEKIGGNLLLGNDPELDEEDQILQDLQWVPVKGLAGMNIIPKQLKSWIFESRPGDPAVFYSDKKSGQND